MKVLHRTKTHVLRREWMNKRNGGYWFELIEKSTGLTYIFTSPHKDAFNGVTCEKFLSWCKGSDSIKMYKAGAVS